MANLMRPAGLLLAGIALSGCATSPTGRNQLMLVSPEQAISASAEAYQQTLLPMAKEGRLDNNPAATRRVQEITGRIVAQAIQQYPHTRNWDWSVRVIDDPDTGAIGNRSSRRDVLMLLDQCLVALRCDDVSAWIKDKDRVA